MRLAELAPQWYRMEKHDSPMRMLEVGSLAEADTLTMLCPTCFKARGGPVGTHQIVIHGPTVPLPGFAQPGRWAFRGTGFDNLTLEGVGGGSSVLLSGGCGAHFFITAGEIVPA